ncbi:glutamyl aminopeptidase-like [Harmonia axyridis]|uniref:glutamyl aminopeptidase-like n=1 Tax=Harmonia axyridis TaxID=115357 RepID=UPI001E274DE1|nr:glutamyl aminopeptidase-like [Harmonia axyridis]
MKYNINLTMLSNNILLVFHILSILSQLYLVIGDSYRLPSCIIPKHYNLKILTSVEDEIAYTGTLEIVVQCINSSEKLSLHRDSSIKLNRIELNEIETPQNYEPGNKVILENILYSNKMQFLTITTSENLKENQHYLILLDFEGNLSEIHSGIFRGNHSTSSGTSYYAITIFEPMGARRAFPCFDEPGMTATFQLTIGRKEKFKSISNMQLVQSDAVEGKEGWYWDHFMNSFLMSTYQVCFMIYDTEFTLMEKQVNQVKILTRQEMRTQLNLITKTSPKLLVYLQKYFQVPFPFPKLDIITLPHSIGNKDSMSTPGLLIINEQLLFYEPFSMKQDTIQEILHDVAEKMAYQWFSVIAVDWWSDVWFENSLASINAHNALSEMSGDTLIEEDIADAILSFFHLLGGLPLPEAIFGDSTSVTAAIYSIDYRKCDLLLRMAHSIVKKEINIRDLSTNFIKQNSYQKVHLNDFWKMLESYAPKPLFAEEAPLSIVMASWANQVGFPVVEVIRNYESNTAVLKQRAYTWTDEYQRHCWWIPINYVTKSNRKNPDIRGWLKCPNEIVEIGPLSPSDWILLNPNVDWLYKVEYDVENWMLLYSTLKDPSLYTIVPSLNRMQLVNDVFDSTARGNLTIKFLLQFMEFLKHDDSYAVWSACYENMVILKWRLQYEQEALSLLNLYMQNILRPHFITRKSDARKSSSKNVSFDVLITSASCFFDFRNCVREVKNAFKKFREMKQPFHIAPPFSIDQRDIIFCYAIKYGNIDDFEFLLRAFDKSMNIFEREDMLRGLYCTQNASLLRKLPTSRRLKRHSENMFKKKRIFRNVENFTSNTFDEVKHTSGVNRDATSVIKVLKRNEESANLSAEHSTTTMETSSEYTENAITLGDTMESTLEDTTTDMENTSVQSTTSSSEGSADEGQGRGDTDSPSFDFIIRHSTFDIVSDFFYKKIKTISQLEALHYIRLFSERIITDKDIDHFEKFFEENKENFKDLQDHIKIRIHYITQQLKWLKKERRNVVEAFRKEMMIIPERKSAASRRCIKYSLKLMSIICILRVFILRNCFY